MSDPSREVSAKAATVLECLARSERSDFLAYPVPGARERCLLAVLDNAGAMSSEEAAALRDFLSPADQWSLFSAARRLLEWAVIEHSIAAFRAAIACISIAGDDIDPRDRLVMLSVAEDAGRRIGVSFVSELSLVRHLMSREAKAGADSYLDRSDRSAGPIGMRGVEMPEGFRYRPWP